MRPMRSGHHVAYAARPPWGPRGPCGAGRHAPASPGLPVAPADRVAGRAGPISRGHFLPDSHLRIFFTALFARFFDTA